MCWVIFPILGYPSDGDCGEEKILSDLWDLCIINLWRVQNLSGVLYCIVSCFFSLLVAWGPFVCCLWVLRIYFLGVFVTNGSQFISVPLGSIEGGSGAGPLLCEYFLRSSQMESWRQAFLVLIVASLRLLDPGSGTMQCLACLWTTVSPALRHAWFSLKWTLESFDEDKKDLYLLWEVKWRGNPAIQQETNFSSSANPIIISFLPEDLGRDVQWDGTVSQHL